MRECLLTVLEDVLIGPDDIAYPRFYTMYTAMATEYTTVLFTKHTREKAHMLCQTNRIKYDLLMDKGTSALTDESWKVSQVREVSSMGWPIGFYWDVDPYVVRQVFAMGVSTLLLSHRVLRPSWLPSVGPPRAWEELVTFMDEQRQHETSDAGSGGEPVVSGGGRVRRGDVPDRD